MNICMLPQFCEVGGQKIPHKLGQHSYIVRGRLHNAKSIFVDDDFEFPFFCLRLAILVGPKTLSARLYFVHKSA